MNKRELMYGALSFLLPALLLLAGYAALEVFPFGEKSLLLVDMDNEYIDYYAHLNRTLRERGSFMRAWEMGMGLNMMGLIAFYTASAFNMLVLLFPVERLTEAVLLITLLKVGSCGLTMGIYTRLVFGEKVPRPILLCASVAYALCGYNLAYSSNIMWLDGAACLPLVLLGVEQVIRHRRCGLLFGSLIYLFLSGYYIGYMVGVFSFLYLCAVYLSQQRACWKKFFPVLRRYLATAVLAAGCSAFLLLPAFLELRSGQEEMWRLPVRWTLEIPMTSLSAKLLPGVYDSLTNSGLPHIYTTVAFALGAVLFFFCKGISRREKAVFGAFTGLLLLCFSCEILNLAWHAFEDPTWFPARYSFLFSFLLLYLSLRAVASWEAQSMTGAAAAAGILLFLFLETGVRRLPFAGSTEVLLGMVLAVQYTALMVLWGRKRQTKALAAALLLLVCAEVSYNTWGMLQGMDHQFSYRLRSSYYGYREAMLPAVTRAQELEEVPLRMEVVQQRNANGGMALGYRGISHYSTTTDQSLNKWLKLLGYNTGTINELRFATTTPLTNGLLGVGTVLSTRPLQEEGYRLLEQVNGVGIYHNLVAFPLAFYAWDEALEALPEEQDPFLLQNHLVESLNKNNSTAFHPVEEIQENLYNLVSSAGNGYVEYQRPNPAEPGILEFVLYNDTGREAYAFLPVLGQGFGRVQAEVNGVEVQRELAYRHNSVIPLGAEEDIVLRLVFQSNRAVIKHAYFYTLDLEAATTAAARAWEGSVDFSHFGGRRVDGAFTAPHDGALVTTFPYDKGWRVYLDGRRVDTQKFAQVFLAVPVTGGQHTVSLRYTAPGFRTGLILSLLSLGVWFIWTRREQK